MKIIHVSMETSTLNIVINCVRVYQNKKWSHVCIDENVSKHRTLTSEIDYSRKKKEREKERKEETSVT